MSEHTDIAERGLSLLFAPGDRPRPDDLDCALGKADSGGLAARISHRAPAEQGWIEILASGLTFDLMGLAPAAAVPALPPAIAVAHVYGFEAGLGDDTLEAATLVPSAHISAGAALAPVVRTMMGLAANLVLNLPVVAVAWHPAGTLIEPHYFVRIVMNWLAGGAFPALGLTALDLAEDGCVSSQGLAHFIGQEVRIEGRAGQAPAEAMKLAIRVVDFLSRQGPLRKACTIAGDTGGGGAGMIAEPSQYGKLVWVWHKD